MYLVIVIILLILIISINFISKTEHMTAEEVMQNLGSVYNDNEILTVKSANVPNLTVKGNVSFYKFYPADCVYLTMDKNFNPNTVFGGSWNNFQNYFLMCEKTNKFKLSPMGGSTKITIDNLPAHNHSIDVPLVDDRDVTSDGSSQVGRAITSYQTKQTSTVGGGKDYMPPYFTVYGWSRYN